MDPSSEEDTRGGERQRQKMLIHVNILLLEIMLANSFYLHRHNQQEVVGDHPVYFENIFPEVKTLNLRFLSARKIFRQENL